MGEGGGEDTDDSGTDVPDEKVVGGLEEEEATSLVEAVGDVPEVKTGLEVEEEGVVLGGTEVVVGTDVVGLLEVGGEEVGVETGGGGDDDGEDELVGELGDEEGGGGGEEVPGLEVPGEEVLVVLPPGW